MKILNRLIESADFTNYEKQSAIYDGVVTYLTHKVREFADGSGLVSDENRNNPEYKKYKTLLDKYFKMYQDTNKVVATLRKKQPRLNRIEAQQKRKQLQVDVQPEVDAIIKNL